MVADIHFGKAASFRANGIPVPHGTTDENLAALDALLASHAIEEIVFLGDFLHAKPAHAATTLATIGGWRSRHAALRLTLVRGNHDTRAGEPPVDLGIRVVDEPHRIGALACCHHPQRVQGHYALAGHLHPVYRLYAAGDALRLPCFVLSAHTAVLPAFGAFTGGKDTSRRDGERLFVATETAVVEIPGGSVVEHVTPR